MNYGWEFIFLGANIDAVQTAGQLGISPDRAVDYLADSEGIKLSHAVIAKVAMEFHKSGEIRVAALTPLRADMKRRGGRK
jgi:hypothetical protein